MLCIDGKNYNIYSDIQFTFVNGHEDATFEQNEARTSQKMRIWGKSGSY